MKRIIFELANQVIHSLTKKNLFIVTVESCTGGGLANVLTNISGASEVMTSGFITYSTEQKIALGVPAEIITQHSVYSDETAVAMAEAGIRSAVRADIGVGITGSISRVDPVNTNSRPGEVCIAVKFGNWALVKILNLKNESERWEIKDKIIIEALKMVLRVLKRLE